MLGFCCWLVVVGWCVYLLVGWLELMCCYLVWLCFVCVNWLGCVVGCGWFGWC